MSGLKTTRGRFSQLKDLHFPKGCGSYEIDFRPISINRFNSIPRESKVIRTIENSLSNEEEILDNEFSESNNDERYSDHRTGRALDDNPNRFGNNQFSNNRFGNSQGQIPENEKRKKVTSGAYDPELYHKRRDDSGKIEFFVEKSSNLVFNTTLGKYKHDNSGKYVHDDSGKYIHDNRGVYVHIPGPDGPPAPAYSHVILTIASKFSSTFKINSFRLLGHLVDSVDLARMVDSVVKVDLARMARMAPEVSLTTVQN